MAYKMTTYKDRESNKQTYVTVAEVLPMSLLSSTSHPKLFSLCCSKMLAVPNMKNHESSKAK